VDVLEGFLDVCGIEANQWVLTDFGTMDGFTFYFVDVALAAFLGQGRSRRDDWACQ
jgi:hypothetical protein